MPPLADAAKLNFEVQVHGSTAAGGGQSQNTVTTLHYIRSVTGAAFNHAAFITAFHALVKPDWLAAVSLHWTWEKTTVRCLNSPIEGTVEEVVTDFGEVAGDGLPANVAVVMSKKSANRGRRYNGRAYIAGLAEGSTTLNSITAGASQTLFNTLATRLKTGFSDAGSNTYVPALFSRFLSTFDPDTDPSIIVMVPLTNVTARPILGSLNSRKSRVA